MNKLKSMDNLVLFSLFEIFREPLFWGPILIAYIINVGGMSLSEVYFMEAVTLILVLFIEIYSSAWADLLGRKKILTLGTIINLLGVSWLSICNSPIDVWGSNILIMIGYAMISGTDQAMIADHLKELGREHEYLKYMSKIQGRRLFVVIFACVLSGYMYSLDPRLPFYLSMPGILVPLIVSFLLTETKRKDRASQKENIELVKISVVFMANHKKLKWIVGFFVVMGVVSKLWFFTYNPYFELVGLDPRFYGWVFAAINVVAWLVTKNSHKIKEIMGEYGVIIASILTMSLPLIWMGMYTSIALISMLGLNNFFRGISGPISSDMKNKYLDSKNRATVLSLSSALSALCGLISLSLFGLLLGYISLANSLIILGLVTFSLGIIFLLKYRKIFM
ncbi:hypothetical protein C0584_00460 [Candidatus Parcubacteria bacterium]|nr:MAG: hypothetical protein C0584_00460 [Candidatus Parcubacteria bacterium]